MEIEQIGRAIEKYYSCLAMAETFKEDKPDKYKRWIKLYTPLLENAQAAYLKYQAEQKELEKTQEDNSETV